jgi:hypothetical protein
VENQEFELVEGSAPLKMEEPSSTTSNVSVRGKKRKTVDNGDNLD